MTSLKFFPALVVIALTLPGCSSNDKQDFSNLDAEILDIHDEVMPKLEDLNHYAEEIRSRIAQLDSLQQEGVSSNTFAEQRLKANDLLTRLHTADSLMWDWMRKYEADSAKALPSAEETVQYFKNEKTKILDVKEKTESSIREAQSFLEH